MYVVVQHRIKNPQIAFSRGERLIKNEGAPSGVRGLQFYPREAPSVESVQRYVDSTLGDSSENSCYEVATEKAFAERPSAISESAGRQVA